MEKYLWCEDSKSGYQFWRILFKAVYPDIIVVTQNNNSQLSKAVGEICDDGNIYYIILDTAIDNPDVLRELKRLNRNISGKNNVKIIKIHSFEFSLLSFEFLEQWVFAEKDELKEKRNEILEAKNLFVKLIKHGGNPEELNEFKSVYHYSSQNNTEKISAKLLYEITRNTGFETSKSKIGECFINSCCEWSDRQEDDICGLEHKRLTLSEKIKQLIEHSVIQDALREVGL